ncbi:MAG: redoxin domain-containing protein [Spirochaetes bacterium]|jgi:thiol-disulfide isomerase/thioredoxin|nr:redoxin domain-containing protein [Spirochaetota bacterium]
MRLHAITYIAALALLIAPTVAAGGNNEQAPEAPVPEQPSESEGTVDPAADEAANRVASSELSDAELITLFSDLGLQTPEAPVDAVDFELPILSSDTRRSLASFEGNVVLLNFWASWCPPCIEEMPSMQSLYERLGGAGFEIVAVNLQEDPKTVRSFMDENGYDFPVLLDRNGRIAREYGVRGIPTSYLVHSDGRLLAMLVGPYEWDGEGMVSAIETIAQ